jgi:NhaA family Na+:H+ antiporter
MKVRILIPYLTGGVLMWYFMLKSGVHPTLSGVLLAFALPFGDGGNKSPSYILEHVLDKPVAYFILPLFALANTCLPLGEGFQNSLLQAYSLGIMAGLVIGKPLGIWLFTTLAIKLRISVLPQDLHQKHILGAGFLGGIGFTMSIFITLLAFDDPAIISGSKSIILIASVIAGTAGLIWLKSTLRDQLPVEELKQNTQKSVSGISGNQDRI